MPTACPAKTWLKLIFFVAQTDAAAAGDHDGFVVEGIVDVWQAAGGNRYKGIKSRGQGPDGKSEGEEEAIGVLESVIELATKPA
jgi:hypothetical protein